MRRLRLTGIHEGKTMVLRGVRFVDGVATPHCSEDDFKGLLKYLHRCDGVIEDHGRSQDHVQHEERPVQDGDREVHQEGSSSEAPSDDGPADADPDPGEEGLSSDGDGPGADPDLTFLGRVAQAVMRLDPADDEHWTSDGRPRVDAVAEMLPDEQISRKDLDDAAPGFVRHRGEE